MILILLFLFHFIKKNSKKEALIKLQNLGDKLQNSDIIENKHILLVDDIITTGATLESCINTLNHAKNIKISVATMAIA